MVGATIRSMMSSNSSLDSDVIGRRRPFPGIGAGVAVAETLEVLRGHERRHVRAVTEHHQGTLRPFEALFDHHRVPAPPNARPLNSRARHSTLLQSPRVTSTPLPAARPSVFITLRRRHLGEERHASLIIETRRRRRDVGAREELFQIRLRAFESRPVRTRSDDGLP